jgi:hypothetical protein
VITDERLKELIREHKERAIHFEQLSDNGRLPETLKAADPHWEAHNLYRELLSLRAKHDKIMEALREANFSLTTAANHYSLGQQDWSQKISSELRALSKLGEVTG